MSALVTLDTRRSGDVSHGGAAFANSRHSGSFETGAQEYPRTAAPAESRSAGGQPGFPRDAGRRGSTSGRMAWGHESALPASCREVRNLLIGKELQTLFREKRRRL